MELKRKPRVGKLTGMSVRSPPAFDPLRFVAAPATPKSREAEIAELAYFRALNRGFALGHEEEDWLAAEAEFDSRIVRRDR